MAFTYLSDISSEFTSIYPSGQYLSSTAKSYGYIEFDTYIQKAKRSYQDSRATQNLDKLNDELKDVTKVMTKNIEELLYRGDSLDKMGEMSGRLREDSRKYKKAAVKINWDAMLAKVSIIFLVTTLLWGANLCFAFQLVGTPHPRTIDLVLYAFCAAALRAHHHGLPDGRDLPPLAMLSHHLVQRGRAIHPASSLGCRISTPAAPARDTSPHILPWPGHEQYRVGTACRRCCRLRLETG